MSRSLAQTLADLRPELRTAWLAEQDEQTLRDIERREWWWVARPEQLTPPGDWFVWLLTPGRGFGKTRTGAEWVADRAIRHPVDTSGFPTEHLLIAETLTDAMRQCVYGPAGVLRVLRRRVGPEWKPGVAGGTWRLLKTPKPSIEILATGAKIYIEGADNEDVGRGYNAASAWLDEFAKWPKPDGSWTEGIMPGLRADLPNDFPRAVVTTTPKLVVQLVDWIGRNDGSVHVTHGSTYDNAANLAAPVVAELHRRYSGTRLGRQELLGELIMEAEGALWALPDIENNRVSPRDIPRLTKIGIGMDPAGAGTRDETGLVCAGRGVDDHDYILGDWSKRIVGREAARRAWTMFDTYGAHILLYEWNQGQEWLTQVMTDAYKELQKEGVFPPGGNPPMRAIRAKKAKRLRAEPVAMRYEQGRVHHVRGQKLQDLETQMISWVPTETPESPDRVDALVYACLFMAGEESMAGDLVTPSGALPTGSISPLAGTLGGYGGRLPGAFD